jgi:TIR domain
VITVPHDVFISYATIDKPIADAVCAKLEERGIRCWIAPRDILAGMDYAEAIIVAIDSAKIMVLIFSSHANASQHVMREAGRAVHDGYPIIPFRIEDVQPNPSLQYYISAQHWLDALTPPLEQHILKLAETVSILLGKPIPPPTQEIPPQPPGSSALSTTRRPSRRTHALSAVIVLVAISVIAAGYYGTQQGPPSSSSIWPPGIISLSGTTVTYQNPQIGVKFTYPQNWSVLKDPTSNGRVSVCYYLIYPTNRNNALDSVQFYKVDKQGWLSDSNNNTTLNYINASINSWYTESSNVTIIQNATPTTLGGVPAYKITFSLNLNKDPNDPRMHTNWLATKGAYIYI